jgi:phosphocarrier protein
MVSKELTVINDSGIHARPAALIVETATKFKSAVIFIKDGMRANAKSIMNIMLLAAEPGAVIRVEADGPDEGEALAAIENLFMTKFKYD